MNGRTQTIKPTFYTICTEHQFNSTKLQELSTDSGVPYAVINEMCNIRPVEQSHAEKVLVAFSKATSRKYTLNNVNVPLLPIIVKAKGGA